MYVYVYRGDCATGRLKKTYLTKIVLISDGQKDAKSIKQLFAVIPNTIFRLTQKCKFLVILLTPFLS